MIIKLSKSLIPRLFSYLFHPVFMPVVGLLLIFHSGIYSGIIPANYTRYLFMIVILCNIILPVSIIPALIYLKYLDNIHIDERRERLLPMFFGTICYYGGYYIISKFSPSFLINTFLLASTIIVFCLLLVSFYWKISIHMAGIGGITGLIIILSVGFRIEMVVILCLSILVAGIIASSRLALGAHNILQILAGYILGLAVVIVLMM